MDIRVHVSGPSRGSDDARYRSEAQALLALDVDQRVTVLSQLERGDNGDIESAHSGPSEAVSALGSLGQTQQTEAIREFFNSRLRSETPRGTPLRYNELHTPAMNKAASPSSPWTMVKETPRLLVKATPFPSRAQTKAPSPKTLHRGVARSQSDSCETPPSVIPDSQEQPLHAAVASPILKRRLIQSSPSQGSPRSPTRKRLRNCSVSSSPSQQLQSQIELLQTQEIGPGASILGQEGGSAVITNGLNSQKVIWPQRAPEVGNHRFETHLTPNLKLLAKGRGIAQLGIQCPMTRPIGVMERGYWRVDISAWNEPKKTKLWKLLRKFVGRGLAGWGVWCARGIDAEFHHEHEGDHAGPRTDILKLWCFGEVIRELLILLYIGGVNNKDNPGTNPEWIDSNGDTVATAKGRHLGV